MPLTSPRVRSLAPDRVVYLHEGELRAQRIDVDQSVPVGAPETLATGVPEDSAAQGAFSVSAAGTVAYRAGGVATELAWFDRTGRMLGRAAAPDEARQVIGARIAKHQIPLDWSRDGRFLLYLEGTNVAVLDGDLFALPLIGATRTPLPIATTSFRELGGQFSPDARWVAYETHQSGRAEIMVQPLPDGSAGAVQVSIEGGSTPRWSADGREVYFMPRDGTLMATEVSARAGRFEAGVPRPLFRSAALDWFGWFQYDVDRTGRFLMSVATDATPPIRLLLNWKPAN